MGQGAGEPINVKLAVVGLKADLPEPVGRALARITTPFATYLSL
jgi:hypothetical protein